MTVLPPDTPITAAAIDSWRTDGVILALADGSYAYLPNAEFVKLVPTTDDFQEVIGHHHMFQVQLGGDGPFVWACSCNPKRIGPPYTTAMHREHLAMHVHRLAVRGRA